MNKFCILVSLSVSWFDIFRCVGDNLCGGCLTGLASPVSVFSEAPCTGQFKCSVNMQTFLSSSAEQISSAASALATLAPFFRTIGSPFIFIILTETSQTLTTECAKTRPLSSRQEMDSITDERVNSNTSTSLLEKYPKKNQFRKWRKTGVFSHTNWHSLSV